MSYRSHEVKNNNNNKKHLKSMRLLLTSLHKNHPGRRTAMTTAPDFSHRDLALKVFVSMQMLGKKIRGVA